MKTDLAQNWTLMAVLPYGVDDEMRNKYVACLLGDELASDGEFEEMASKRPGLPAFIRGHGCKFCFQGSCFHPFRTGSIVDAIFASCLGGDVNARQLVNKDAEDALEDRSCRSNFGCTLSMEKMPDDSAFGVVARFYDNLIESVSNGSLYWGDYDTFVEKQVGMSLEGRTFLEMRTQYEENVRSHFDRMMRGHFALALDAVRSDSNGIFDKKKKHDAKAKALLKIRFDLVTHWRTYWASEKYKDKEA